MFSALVENPCPIENCSFVHLVYIAILELLISGYLTHVSHMGLFSFVILCINRSCVGLFFLCGQYYTPTEQMGVILESLCPSILSPFPLSIWPNFITIILASNEWIYFKFGLWLSIDWAYVVSDFGHCTISASCFMSGGILTGSTTRCSIFIFFSYIHLLTKPNKCLIFNIQLHWCCKCSSEYRYFLCTDCIAEKLD